MKDLAASQALPPVSDFMKQTIDIIPRRKTKEMGHRTRDSIYDDLELIGDRDQQSEVMFAASNTHNSNQAGALISSLKFTSKDVGQDIGGGLVAERAETAPRDIPGRSSIGSEIYWLDVDKRRVSSIGKAGRDSDLSN